MVAIASSPAAFDFYSVSEPVDPSASFSSLDRFTFLSLSLPFSLDLAFAASHMLYTTMWPSHGPSSSLYATSFNFPLPIIWEVDQK